MTSTDSEKQIEKLGVALKQGLITQTQNENLVQDIKLEATYSKVIVVGQSIFDRCLITESWEDKHDKQGKLTTKAGSITKIDPIAFPKMFMTASPKGYTLPNGKKGKFTAGGSFGSLVKVVEI